MKRSRSVVLSLGFLVWLAQQAAIAGDARGSGGPRSSGGNVIICIDPKTKVERVELLDFYEAREFRGFKFEARDLKRSWQDLLEDMLRRLGTLDPVRERNYRAEADTFEAEASFKDGIKLVSSGDSFHLAIHEGCTIEQAVTHREPDFPEDKRYLVSNKIWKALDSFNQAGMVAHEAIFREARKYGQEDSLRSRYLNGLLWSTTFEKMAPLEYEKRLRIANFPILQR